MDVGEVLDIFQATIFMILRLAAPFLIISISIGLLVSIFQAATQINEQTLTFVPKIVGIALVLIVLGAWIVNSLSDFFRYLIDIMIRL